MTTALRALAIDSRLVRYIGAGGLAFVVDYAGWSGSPSCSAFTTWFSATRRLPAGQRRLLRAQRPVGIRRASLPEPDYRGDVLRRHRDLRAVSQQPAHLGQHRGCRLPYQFSELLAAGGVLFFNYTARRVVLFSAQSTHAA